MTGVQTCALPIWETAQLVAGTVCDLSAKVGVLVESGTASEAPVVPPTVPTTTPPTSTLPVTGSDTGGLLLLGGLLIGGGAAILLVRRRRPRTS